MSDCNQKPKQKRTLTRDKIFRAAFDLLDKKGAESLSMRGIAEKLGVRQSALYRHISGREEILVGIRELIGEEILGPNFEYGTWDESLRNLGRGYRDAFAAHPEAVPLLATTPMVAAKEVISIYDNFLRILTEEGWSYAEALDIMNAYDSFLLGSALDLASGQEILDPGEDQEADYFQTAFAARKNRNSGLGISGAESAFELGIEIFINGLKALRP